MLRTYALLAAGEVPMLLRERPSGFLYNPMRHSEMAPHVGPEHPFSYYLEKAREKLYTKRAHG